MVDLENSLSWKIEKFVAGIIRFLCCYLRTLALTAGFCARRLLSDRRHAGKTRLVHPLTFLVIGCFFFSLIADIYADGWAAYLNSIWLGDEIGLNINLHAGDLFSLTSVVSAALPTFLCYAAMARLLSSVMVQRRFIRPRTERVILYALGLHVNAFAIACYLPVFSDKVFSGEGSDSFVNTLYLLFGGWLTVVITSVFAAVAFLSPIALFYRAVSRPDARLAFRLPLFRLVLACSAFFTIILFSVEVGTLPARFKNAVVPAVVGDFQVIDGPTLFGQSINDLSRADLFIIVHNKTEKIGYIDGNEDFVHVSISGPDGSGAIITNLDIRLLDEDLDQRRFIALPPGAAKAVYLQVRWILDPNFAMPQPTVGDDHWSYDGVTVRIDFDLVKGFDLPGDLHYELVNPTVYRQKNAD